MKLQASLTFTERVLCLFLILLLSAINGVCLFYGISHFIEATTKPVIVYSQETITKFPHLGLIFCSYSSIPILSPILSDTFQGPVGINSYARGPSSRFYPNSTILNGYQVYIFAMGDIDLTRGGYQSTVIYGRVSDLNNWASAIGILPFDLEQGPPSNYDPLSFYENFFPLNGMSQIHASVVQKKNFKKSNLQIFNSTWNPAYLS